MTADDIGTGLLTLSDRVEAALWASWLKGFLMGGAATCGLWILALWVMS